MTIALMGCVSASEPFGQTVDADGLTSLRVDIERGDVFYTVRSDDVFVVEGTSRALASSQSRADERLTDNAWRVDAQPPELVVEAQSVQRRASVDVEVFGPSVVDLNIIANQGVVTLMDVEGTHVVQAGRIQTTRLRGSVRLTGTGGGIDAEIYPFFNGSIVVEGTSGDVIVRLPFGGNYDVEILGDPDFEMFVSEFGFVGSIAQPGYFTGVAGDGSIPVRITAQGGSVQLLEAL
ncbi:MAG: hypothetical protein ACJAZO_004667 [Myxococcota bacterium]|jgi:hypothetical protein